MYPISDANVYHPIRPVYPVIRRIPVSILAENYNALNVDERGVLPESYEERVQGLLQSLKKTELLDSLLTCQHHDPRLIELAQLLYPNYTKSFKKLTKYELLAGVLQVANPIYYFKWLSQMYSPLSAKTNPRAILSGTRFRLKLSAEDSRSASEFITFLGGEIVHKVDIYTQYIVFSEGATQYEADKYPKEALPIRLNELEKLSEAMFSAIHENQKSLILEHTGTGAFNYLWDFTTEATVYKNSFRSVLPVPADFERATVLTFHMLPAVFIRLYKTKNGGMLLRNTFAVPSVVLKNAHRTGQTMPKELIVPYLPSIDFTDSPVPFSLPALFHKLSLPNMIPLCCTEHADNTEWISLNYCTASEKEEPRVVWITEDKQHRIRVVTIASSFTNFIRSLKSSPPNKSTYLVNDLPLQTPTIIHSLKTKFDITFHKLPVPVVTGEQASAFFFEGVHEYWKDLDGGNCKIVVRPQKNVNTAMAEFKDMPHLKWVLEFDYTSKQCFAKFHLFVVRQLKCIPVNVQKFPQKSS